MTCKNTLFSQYAEFLNIKEGDVVAYSLKSDSPSADKEISLFFTDIKRTSGHCVVFSAANLSVHHGH